MEYNEETIEEAAQKLYPIDDKLDFISKFGLNYVAHKAFIQGAEFQTKRSYSEEEVKQIAKYAFNAGRRMELNAFPSDFSFDDLDSVFLLTLLKIVQECCNNSMKHSGADRINVTMNKKGNEMHICVSDNGRGCSENCLEKGHHFGLDIIRERVSMLSGICRFECNEGNGFRVTIILPMIRTEGDIMNERENTNCG